MKGYAGSILKVDLSSRKIDTVSTSVYADRFIGGRGIAVKIHWDEVPATAYAFDPGNRLVFMTGPVCGMPGFAGSRWQISGKSPLSNSYTYCNLGGSWGAQLKFAGFDGLVVSGRADGPVYLLIDNGHVEIRDAADLSGKGAIKTREMLKDRLGDSFRIVSIGPAGENRVIFAGILADEDSSGSGGLGAVMGAKNLKAVAVRGDHKLRIAQREKAGDLRKKIKQLKGGAPSGPRLLPGKYEKGICFGCIHGCIRNNYMGEDGQKGKTMCQSGLFYYVRALRFYKESTDIPFQATKLCDDFGMDTYPVEMAIKWLDRCRKAGLVSDESTGLPLSKIGSLEFIEALVRKIALREGIGDLMANGIRNAAKAMGEPFSAMITDYVGKTDAMQVYDPRLYLTTGMFWAMEPRLPIAQLHEISRPLTMWAAKASKVDFMGLPEKDNYMTSEVLRNIGKKFWGSEIAGDFSTYEGKALAAAKIQDRQNLQESLVLCDMAWPVIYSPNTEDHAGVPGLGHEILSVVTGIPLDEDTMEQFGQRIFAAKRAIEVRDGHRGREDDVLEEFHFTIGVKTDFLNENCIVPGKDGEIFSRKGMTVDREAFEKMKGEYYEIRQWDPITGLPTRKSLESLDLKEFADGLEKVGKLSG
jgi:aldehyde:ferredoxin oxidoreductase